MASSNSSEADRHALRFATFGVLVLVVAGALCVAPVKTFNLKYASFFYQQFAGIEPLALALTAVFVLAALLVLQRAPTTSADYGSPFPVPNLGIVAGTMLMAIAAFVLAAIGTDLVFHRYLFVDDEYAAWFQAVIFAHGQRQAVVSPEWCRWITSLTPDTISATQCTWHLVFLPIHSLIRAAFIAVDLDRFAGPALAATSIVLIVAVARKAWPDRPDRSWLAAAILGTSTQVLFMSMTMYAMPTHLVFALIWLWLYLDDRRWAIVILPWVGFLALGVHSPTPHLLFVPPFWIRFVRRRRFGTAAYVGAVYALGLVFWIGQYGQTAMTVSGGMASPATTLAAASGLFHRPGSLHAITTVMHLSLIATWNTPIALICLLAALLAWNRLDTFTRDLGLSLLLILVARVFIPTPQGGGWGYRYIYEALGNFALVAACGVDVLGHAIGSRPAKRLVVASLAVSLLLQLPMRAIQVERLVRPYSSASAWLATLPEKIIVLPAEGIMWGSELVRNDPFLEHGNKIMSESRLGSTGFGEIQRQFPGQVRLVLPAELVRFGLERAPFRLGPLLISP